MKIKNYLIANFQSLNRLVIQENIRRYQGLSRVLPDFIIVGAQKAGTTSLFHYLKQHPQIIGSQPSEVHFFDYKFHKGLSLYKSYFPTKTEINQQQNKLNKIVITGECSPSYLFFPSVAQKIVQTLPQVKIIILLRDPVARTYSHYQHEVRKGREKLSFAEAVAREESGELAKKYRSGEYSPYQYACKAYLARSRYIEQIEAYAQLFDSQNILILFSERFFSNTQQTYQQVVDFLGLETFTIIDRQAKNVGNYSKKDIPLQKYLSSYYHPYNQQLASYLQQSLDW